MTDAAPRCNRKHYRGHDQHRRVQVESRGSRRHGREETEQQAALARSRVGHPPTGVVEYSRPMTAVGQEEQRGQEGCCVGDRLDL